MKSFFILAALLIPFSVLAAPTGRATVDAATATCTLAGVPVTVATVSAAAGFCPFDLAGVAPGNYTAVVTPKNSLGQAGPSGSFPFTLPAVPAAPSAWQLLP